MQKVQDLHRDSVPKAIWCLKQHGSLYLPVKKIQMWFTTK